MSFNLDAELRRQRIKFQNVRSEEATLVDGLDDLRMGLVCEAYLLTREHDPEEVAKRLLSYAVWLERAVEKLS